MAQMITSSYTGKKKHLKLNIGSFNKRLLYAEAPIAIAFLTFYVKCQIPHLLYGYLSDVT